MKFALYRIAQESLNNIAKHAQADQVKIKLSESVPASDVPAQNSKHYVELKIADNGVGFDTDNGRSGSMGLGIMQERAKSAGLKLDINTEPGSGTEVQIRWLKPGFP